MALVIRRTGASIIVEWRQLADFGIGTRSEQLLVANFAAADLRQRIASETVGADAAKLTVASDAHFVARTIAARLCRWIARAGRLGRRVGSRTGGFLDDAAQSSVEILEPIDVEPAVRRAGNLLQLRRQHMVRHADGEHLNFLLSGIEGRFGDVVLRSAVGDDDSDSRNGVGNGSGASAVGKSLGDHVLNSGARTCKTRQVLNVFNALKDARLVLELA